MTRKPTLLTTFRNDSRIPGSWLRAADEDDDDDDDDQEDGEVLEDDGEEEPEDTESQVSSAADGLGDHVEEFRSFEHSGISRKRSDEDSQSEDAATDAQKRKRMKQ